MQVETVIDVLEVGDPVPITQVRVTHWDQAHGEERVPGPIVDGFSPLVSVIEDVNLRADIGVSFRRSGTRNIVIRAQGVIGARAHGKSAKLVITQTAARVWDGSATGLMSMNVANATYRIAVDPTGACRDHLEYLDSDRAARA